MAISEPEKHFSPLMVDGAVPREQGVYFGARGEEGRVSIVHFPAVPVPPEEVRQMYLFGGA